MAQWKEKLNKKDLKYLRETNGTTLKAFKRNLEFQSQNQFPCWDCVGIGRKLGLEVELTAFHKRVDE